MSKSKVQKIEKTYSSTIAETANVMQARLHRELIEQLNEVYIDFIAHKPVTLATAVEGLLSFCVAGLIYSYQVTSMQDHMLTKGLGDELTRRLDELIKQGIMHDGKPPKQ